MPDLKMIYLVCMGMYMYVRSVHVGRSEANFLPRVRSRIQGLRLGSYHHSQLCSSLALSDINTPDPLPLGVLLGLTCGLYGESYDSEQSKPWLRLHEPPQHCQNWGSEGELGGEWRALFASPFPSSVPTDVGKRHSQMGNAGLEGAQAALVYLYVCRQPEGNAVPLALGSLI